MKYFENSYYAKNKITTKMKVSNEIITGETRFDDAFFVSRTHSHETFL